MDCFKSITVHCVFEIRKIKNSFNQPYCSRNCNYYIMAIILNKLSFRMQSFSWTSNTKQTISFKISQRNFFPVVTHVPRSLRRVAMVGRAAGGVWVWRERSRPCFRPRRGWTAWTRDPEVTLEAETATMWQLCQSIGEDRRNNAKKHESTAIMVT